MEQGKALGSKVLGYCGLLIGPFALSFVIGIVPGLLFGLPGWHKPAAVVIAIIWVVGYVLQRAGLGHMDWVVFWIALSGAFGLGFSIWFFGSITA